MKYKIVDLSAVPQRVNQSRPGRWAKLAADVAQLPTGKALVLDLATLGVDARRVASSLFQPARKLGIRIGQRTAEGKVYLYVRPGKKSGGAK